MREIYLGLGMIRVFMLGKWIWAMKREWQTITLFWM